MRNLISKLSFVLMGPSILILGIGFDHYLIGFSVAFFFFCLAIFIRPSEVKSGY
ncbi:hypothetical protein MKX54_10865 [Alkalihalobacillus sp. FSL R5-0424]